MPALQVVDPHAVLLPPQLSYLIRCSRSGVEADHAIYSALPQEALAGSSSGAAAAAAWTLTLRDASAGTRQLSAAMQSLHCLPNLVQLDMSGSPLEAAAAGALAAALQAVTVPSAEPKLAAPLPHLPQALPMGLALRELCLAGCCMSSRSTAKVCAALQALAETHGAGAGAGARPLQLEVLDLDGNVVGRRAAQALAAVLGAPASRLRRLRVEGCALGPASASLLAGGVASSDSLTRLAIGHNPLGGHGVREIVEAALRGGSSDRRLVVDMEGVASSPSLVDALLAPSCKASASSPSITVRASVCAGWRSCSVQV